MTKSTYVEHISTAREYDYHETLQKPDCLSITDAAADNIARLIT